MSVFTKILHAHIHTCVRVCVYMYKHICVYVKSLSNLPKYFHKKYFEIFYLVFRLFKYFKIILKFTVSLFHSILYKHDVKKAY